MNHLKRTPEERAALLAHLKKNYDYDPKVGGLRNKKTGYYPKGVNHGRRYARYSFSIEGKQVYISIHIAVWAVCKGRWPTMQLDHLNGNPRDNRIENLRECTGSENVLNKLHPWKPNAKTGVPGVCLKKEGRFETKMRGKDYCFHNPYEAFFWAIFCGKKYK